MIADRRKFGIGLALLAGFAAVFVLLLMPIWGDGQNALDALDALYNSISKGSAYYIEDLQEEAKAYDGAQVSLEMEFEDEEQARRVSNLLAANGVEGTQSAGKLTTKGDLGRLLQGCLRDADDLFSNDAAGALKARYGSGEERRVLHDWWLSLAQMDKDLKRQEAFAQAKFVGTVKTKAVECAYNYYGVVPEKISNKVPIVLLSLVFYVVYTIWYGFAILYLFEGWGMRLGH